VVTAAAASHHRLSMVLLLPFVLVACGGGDGAMPTPPGASVSADPPEASNEVHIGAPFFSPLRYSFGQVAVGHTATKALHVHSDTPEIIREVVVTGAVFSIVDDGCTGATFPGPPCVVRIAATPPTLGEHHGSLSVTTSTGRVWSSDLVVGEQPGPDSPMSSPETPSPETPSPELPRR
jgi:hypothetical protein